MPNTKTPSKTAPQTVSYTLSVAAQIARVSVDFVIECEQEKIIRPIVSAGQKRFNTDALRRIVRARHLHQDLGLELTAIECILRMRRQIIALQKELEDMKMSTTEREHKLLEEINCLRRKLKDEPGKKLPE